MLKCIKFPYILRADFVRHRSQLYTCNQKPAKELLLLSEDNTCLEGSTSNFFVIYRQGYVKTAASRVLVGIASQFVEEACRQLSISLVYEAPNLQDIQDWTVSCDNNGPFTANRNSLCVSVYRRFSSQTVSRLFNRYKAFICHLVSRNNEY